MILGSGAVIPNFPISAKRLTPAPGYLEALCKDNVSQACFTAIDSGARRL